MNVRRLAALIAIALLLRLAIVFVSARLTVDVLRYHKVATHVLDVSLNPYQAPRLYPYPPLWVWFEAGAGWLERQGAPFAVVIKLPVVLADVAIVALLAGWSMRAGWLYALSPVSLLVSGFHGQFDALMLLFVIAAVRFFERGAMDRSALALAGAIATKSLPILLLPFFVIDRGLGSAARRVRFAALATVPVLLSLVPYALDDLTALRRAVGYSGIADFGWIGFYRGLLFLLEGRLVRSEPSHWGMLVPLAKILFLGSAVVLGWVLACRLRLTVDRACIAVFLLFLLLYGAVSAQYLLWPLPLGARRARAPFFAYTLAATAALVGFYGFLAPGVFWDDEVARPWGALWVAGVGLTLAAAAWWLVDVLRQASAAEPHET